MTIHADQLIMNATYWPTKLTRKGERADDGPAQNIPCRWGDMQKEFIDEEGHRRTSTAKVYVAKTLQVGARIARGSGCSKHSARVIKKNRAVPNYDNTGTLYTVWVV